VGIYVLCSLLSYLIGAFPTSFLVGRLFFHVDLKTQGSGNLGATNVFRVLGPWPAAFVLAVDIFKGFAPVFWIPALVDTHGGIIFQIALGLSAVAGHIFSPFIGFRGGKGVATGAGIVLAICPFALALSAAVWLVVMAFSRIVSVASLSAALALPLFVLITIDPGSDGFGVILAFSISITILVFLTHRSNISRLLRGEEKKLARKGRIL
jgi:glycerol-3-phosphate acyltransferase PlsY